MTLGVESRFRNFLRFKSFQIRKSHLDRRSLTVSLLQVPFLEVWDLYRSGTRTFLLVVTHSFQCACEYTGYQDCNFMVC